MRASELVATELGIKRSEARRIIQQGGIWINEKRVYDPDRVVKNPEKALVVLRRGNATGAIDYDLY